MRVRAYMGCVRLHIVQYVPNKDFASESFTKCLTIEIASDSMKSACMLF